MRIALAQANSFLGNFEENRVKALEYILRSVERGCEIVVFAEAFMFGYHPVDLLERSSTVEAQLKELKKLHKQIPKGVSVFMGAITPSMHKTGKLYHNSAVVLEKSKPMKVFAKELLPTYDVFDEARHIEPGDLSKNLIKIKGKRVLVTICEDIWAWPNTHHGKRSPYRTNPLKKVKKTEVDLVINLSASPFTRDKLKSRINVCRQTAQHFKSSVVYVNMVGAQDEIVFDGGSFVTNKAGKVVARADHFCEDILVYDENEKRGHLKEPIKEETEKVRQALVLGIKDFVRKIGFERVHLGLSGGIDSAVVACLAADAIGPHNVACLALPGPYSSQLSYDLAKKLCENLNCNWHEIEISESFKSIDKKFRETFGEFAFGVVDENFQARLRGLLLMGFSNLNSSLLLNTSNKTEFATGYSTLYGDQAGGLSPIGDLLKHQVYELAAHYNKEYLLIPQELIDREPSAELRPNQKDSDTLYPYSELDPVVEKLVEDLKAPSNAMEHDILRKLSKSEFKRWQAPPILKVSNHAFGRGRRLPVAHGAFY